MRAELTELRQAVSEARARVAALEEDLSRHREDDHETLARALAATRVDPQPSGLAAVTVPLPDPSRAPAPPMSFDLETGPGHEDVGCVVVAPVRDPLEELPGVGQDTRRRLWDLGARTFADVASLDVDALAVALSPAPGGADPQALARAVDVQAAARVADSRRVAVSPRA